MYCGIRNVNSSILAFHDDTGCNHAAMVIAAYLQRGKSSSLARPYPAQASAGRSNPARRSGPDPGSNPHYTRPLSSSVEPWL